MRGSPCAHDSSSSPPASRTRTTTTAATGPSSSASRGTRCVLVVAVSRARWRTLAISRARAARTEATRLVARARWLCTRKRRCSSTPRPLLLLDRRGRTTRRAARAAATARRCATRPSRGTARTRASTSRARCSSASRPSTRACLTQTCGRSRAWCVRVGVSVRGVCVIAGMLGCGRDRARSGAHTSRPPVRRALVGSRTARSC